MKWIPWELAVSVMSLSPAVQIPDQKSISLPETSNMDVSTIPPDIMVSVRTMSVVEGLGRATESGLMVSPDVSTPVHPSESVLIRYMSEDPAPEDTVVPEMMYPPSKLC